MSPTSGKPNSPLLLASLSSLPEELCLAVIEKCDMASIIALSMTNRKFQRLADPYHKSRHSQMLEFLAKAQDFPQWQGEGFACFSCDKVLPKSRFSKTHLTGKRGRNGGGQKRRFCVQCGVDKGLFPPGAVVKQGGCTFFVCRHCKDLKGGRFCCICKFRTQCNREHGYGIKSLGPCGGADGHEAIMGDELPRVDHAPALSLAGLAMRDYEAMTGESASPEWYDGPDDA
jgi:hypothetical protein